MRLRPFLVCLLLLSAIFVSFGQTKPLTAVMPFNPNNVSENDAQIISALFETGLVRTDAFLVIEQNQIDQILEAQAFTVSGCTDESCAVEFGKMLAAEQIILGDFSLLGEEYIITAKIIDVELGKNIRAEKVSVNSLDDLSSAAELLAFKLAGLTYVESGEAQIATAFGELFVETDPEGATVFINGIEKGTSPDLFQRIPAGLVTIEARIGELYARQTVNVAAGFSEIKLDLKRSVGNLYIKCPEKQMDVYLNGEHLGALGNGLFRDLPAGQHQLSLRGNGLYWEEGIQIAEDESTPVEAYPRAFGRLQFKIPKDALLTLEGSDNYQFRGVDGVVRANMVWAGNYRATVQSAFHVGYETELSVAQGELVSFFPEMAFTPEYQLNLAENRFRLLYNKRFSIDRTKAAIGVYLAEIDVLRQDFSASGFAELAAEAAGFYATWQEMLNKLVRGELRTQLRVEEEALAALERRHAEGTRSKEVKTTTAWIMQGVGAAALAGAGAAFVLMNDRYEKYRSAWSSAELTDLREQTELFRWTGIGSAAGAGAVCITGLIIGLTGGSPEALEEEMSRRRTRIAELKVELEAVK